jgi:hypothetical protein
MRWQPCINAHATTGPFLAPPFPQPGLHECPRRIPLDCNRAVLWRHVAVLRKHEADTVSGGEGA